MLDIQTIQQLIKAKQYQVKLHALQHALKENDQKPRAKTPFLQ